jgi:acyl carrier protein
MSKEQRVLKAVQRAVKEVNQQRPAHKRIGQSVGTALVGESGVLDSLGLVSFLVVVEQEVNKELKVEINLIEDEAIVSDHHNALQNIGTLVDHIIRLLDA